MSKASIIRKKRGMSPGSLIFTGTQKVDKLNADLFIYNQESISEKTVKNIDELKAFTGNNNIVWINICGLHETDKIGRIGEMFNIHPLVLEDVLNVNHSPKIEEGENHLFIISKMIDYNGSSESLKIEQVSFVLGKNYLITFQETEGDVFNVIRERLRTGAGRIRKSGADYLMYRLLDSIVDTYEVILSQFDDKIEKIEDDLFEKPTKEILGAIHKFRKQVNIIKRELIPLKEVINSIEKDTHPLIQKQNLIYIKDLNDHIKSGIAAVENYREHINGMIEVYRSNSGLKLNEIVKVLTIISTIFIPLTFIAGVYGMNFNPDLSPFNMPELNWRFGYPLVLIVMFLIAAGLLIIFKKNDWI